MLLPTPHLLDSNLDQPAATTCAAARRFAEGTRSELTALSDLPVLPADARTSAAPRLTAKQRDYDRYFGVERTDSAPADTLARATIDTVREMAVNAAAGHSLSPLEEHLLIGALRLGLQMILPEDTPHVGDAAGPAVSAPAVSHG